MYRRSDLGFGMDGGAAILSLDQALLAKAVPFGRAPSQEFKRPRFYIEDVADLGLDIGTARWWRGLASCVGLCALTFALAPGITRLPAVSNATLSPAAWEEARAQSIAPLAWGADSGRHMAATDTVQPLTDTPERPQIDLAASLGEGDGLARALERAGVSSGDAAQVATMTSDIIDPSDLKAGAALNLTLGRRASRTQPRPLDALAFRARFDMKLAFARNSGRLMMQRIPIAVDHTPIRISGQVGDSLYAAARAAGAPPKVVESYIRALAPKVAMDSLGGDARFDFVVEHARAQTGEVEFGKLLYVGMTRGDRATRMIEWTVDGRTEWYDAAGVGERRAGFVMPVSGARKTSGFGLRFHPLLGYSRMHQGVDYGVYYGTPIHAVTDGTVSFAGWHGGHGNFVKLNHAGGLGTGYAHMSRIAVAPGTHVSQGQVIGYVGSTGLSTGPHLHFEVYRNGAPVNPGEVNFATTSLLQGAELAAFRAKLASITAFRPVGERIASR